MAGSSKQAFEITDFSGGITDNIFSGQTNTSYVLDNFFVTPDKKLLSRPGSVLDDAAHSPVPAGNQRVGVLINYARNDKLFAGSANQLYYRSGANTGAWTILQGPSGNPVLNSGTTSNFMSWAEWNKQVFVVNDAFANPVKFFKDGSGVYKAHAVGLPALASTPTVTPGASTPNSYIYAFVMTCQYTVWTQTFLEEGPTTLRTVSSGDPSTSANAISAIPVLTNSGGLNYDTTNVKIDIYRTINNGTNFYKIGSVANGTTTFSDHFADSAIQTNAQLYTNDGTLDYTPAPQAKFVHVVGNIGYYGYTKDAIDGEHPYRVHQSVPGNPGFVPAITWQEVEEEVTGLNSVRNMPILLCKKYIYRLDGTYDSQGRGAINPVKIHGSAGCISNNSCVEAENYLFWAGNDGFYATDGYQVIKISDHLNTRYQAMLAASANTKRIFGKYDEANRRVYWTVEQTASNLECDSLFALDLRYGVSPNSTFTTCSGNSFRPTALEMFNGYLYRGDSVGFVFRHDPTLTTDPKVVTSVAATTWADETIIWTLTTNQFNFGSSFYRKFVSRILLQAANIGNTTIAMTAINDQGKRSRQLKPVRWRRNVTWGDTTFLWGNTDCVWDSVGLIEQWRRFPAGGLRLSYLQMTITNGLGIIAISDNLGQCALNKGAKTAVLGSGNLWPSESVDYLLKLSSDGYSRGYTISAINNSLDTVTLIDSGSNLPPTGAYGWELWGYEKGEALNLLGFNLHWDNVDQNQQTFQQGDDGANS